MSRKLPHFAVLPLSDVSDIFPTPSYTGPSTMLRLIYIPFGFIAGFLVAANVDLIVRLFVEAL